MALSKMESENSNTEEIESESDTSKSDDESMNEELNEQFNITMSILRSNDEAKIQKLKELVQKNCYEENDVELNKKTKEPEKSNCKALSLKEYQAKLILANESTGNAFEELDSLNMAKRIKRSPSQIIKDKRILEAIKEKSNSLDDNEDFFVVAEYSREDGHSVNVGFTSQPIDETINNPDDRHFIDDHVLNINYQTENKACHDFSNTVCQNIEKKEKDPQVEKTTPMIVSFPRKIESSSRQTNKKRTQKRENRLKNKLRKKKEMIEKLKLEKIKKKQQILSKIKSISTPQDVNEDEIYPDIDTNAEFTGSAEEDCAEEDGGKKLSKRRLKKLARINKNIQKYKKKQIDVNPKNEELMDEYYNMDYEDVIDDIPVRYNYTTVPPNSYGLTPEQILLCDDKELNKWCSMRKVLSYKTESEEQLMEKMYKRRIKNPKIRMRALSSIYGSKLFESNLPKPSQKTKSKSTSIVMKKDKLVKRYFNKANSQIINKLDHDRLLAYNLKNDRPLAERNKKSETKTE